MELIIILGIVVVVVCYFIFRTGREEKMPAVSPYKVEAPVVEDTPKPVKATKKTSAKKAPAAKKPRTKKTTTK